jgi:hypothetical protein
MDSTNVVFPLSGGPIKMIRGGCEPAGAGGADVCASRTLPSIERKATRICLNMLDFVYASISDPPSMTRLKKGQHQKARFGLAFPFPRKIAIVLVTGSMSVIALISSTILAT